MKFPPLLITDRVPYRLVPIEDSTGGLGPKPEGVLRRFRAVGAVADARYQSGRVILADAQKAAVAEAISTKREMTMYVGHPGKECEDWEKIIGRVDRVAGKVANFHYDPVTKQTVLDEVHLTETQMGREADALIRGGISLGVSQRYAGAQ